MWYLVTIMTSLLKTNKITFYLFHGVVFEITLVFLVINRFHYFITKGMMQQGQQQQRNQQQQQQQPQGGPQTGLPPNINRNLKNFTAEQIKVLKERFQQVCIIMLLFC